MKVSFNKAQLKQLAQINGNLSILFFGTVIAPAFAEVDDIDPLLVVLGISIGCAFFVYSLILLKGVKDNES